MTIQQFLQLGEMEQVSTILQRGKLITQHLHTGARVFVYHLETFYVSAAYSIMNDELIDIECFIEVSRNIPGNRRKQINIHPAERQYHTPEF